MVGQTEKHPNLDLKHPNRISHLWLHLHMNLMEPFIRSKTDGKLPQAPENWKQKHNLRSLRSPLFSFMPWRSKGKPLWKGATWSPVLTDGKDLRSSQHVGSFFFGGGRGASWHDEKMNHTKMIFFWSTTFGCYNLVVHWDHNKIFQDGHCKTTVLEVWNFRDCSITHIHFPGFSFHDSGHWSTILYNIMSLFNSNSGCHVRIDSNLMYVYIIQMYMKVKDI